MDFPQTFGGKKEGVFRFVGGFFCHIAYRKEERGTLPNNLRKKLTFFVFSVIITTDRKR